MRDYGKVFSSFWTSESTRVLSSDGRLLALYLLTSPHTTMIGAFRLPDGYVADDMGWGLERVSEGFHNLEENGFATRCMLSKWVVITNFLEWNEIENPNQAKAAIKLIEQVPENHPLKPALVRGLMESIGRFKDKIPADLWNRLETLAKGLLNQEQEQEQEQEKGKAPPSKSADCPGPACNKPVNGSPIAFSTFLSRCRESGERPIADYGPVWAYAEKAGIPEDAIVLCWQEFGRKYGEEGGRSSKRYRDWRQAFRNCVEENWFGLWTLDEQGRAVLTSKGRIAEKVTA